MARLRAAIAAWVTEAQPQDETDDAAWGRRRGDALPAALARREERLATSEEARRRWEAHAQQEADVERPRRAEAAAERQRTGKPRRGQAPPPVADTPDDKAQRSLTDPARPSRRPKNKGWEDGGNAQARVDETCHSIGACDVTDASNDTQPAAPLAQATRTTLAHAGMAWPKDAAGVVPSMVATWENGDDREAAVAALATWGCEPSIATERQRHHAPQAEAPAVPATAQERMAAKGRTPAGRAGYARRQVIVEPVCGQSKEARGFRRFLLRGLQHIRGEGRLGGFTQNLLTMWRYGRGLRGV